LEGVRTPSLVAKAVMDETDHHLIVGKGAQDFARGMGFKIEDDLNTENSRKQWLEWKRRTDPQHYLDPKKRAEAGHRVALEMLAKESCAKKICTARSTATASTRAVRSAASRQPAGSRGRFRDVSAILRFWRGAICRRRGRRGRLDRTWRSESLQSLFVCDRREMRRGAHPKDAGMEVLNRIKNNTIEKRLLNDRGLPNFGINFYILNAKGEFAGVTMYEARRSRCVTRMVHRRSSQRRCCKGNRATNHGISRIDY
jgi:N4-(beta-N-acetylglucosaminyl)-L-asparaginase